MWQYFLGTGALGAVVGYFVAMSNSPVVGTLLPLLFSLVSGAGAIYAAKIDIKDPNEVGRLKIIGASLSCFAASLFVASAVAVSYRDAAAEIQLSLETAKSPAHVEHAVRLVQLRHQLSELGADRGEVTRILARAPQPQSIPPDSPAKLMEKTKALQAILLAVGLRLKSITTEDKALNEAILLVRNALELADNSFKPLLEKIPQRDPTALRMMQHVMEHVTHAVHSLVGTPDTKISDLQRYDELSKNIPLLQALLELKAALEVNRPHFDRTEIAVDFNQSSNTLLKKEASPLGRKGWFAYQPTTRQMNGS